MGIVFIKKNMHFNLEQNVYHCQKHSSSIAYQIIWHFNSVYAVCCQCARVNVTSLKSIVAPLCARLLPFRSVYAVLLVFIHECFTLQCDSVVCDLQNKWKESAWKITCMVV